MSAPKRCRCGHLFRSHTERRPTVRLEDRRECYLCDCTGFHRGAGVRLAGPPELDLCRKTDYTGELK